MKKYGLIVDFYPYPARGNLGDYIQSIAIEHLYQYAGIPKEAILPISWKELRRYDGDELILPYNYVAEFLFDNSWGGLPLSSRIQPVFLGISFQTMNYVFGECEEQALTQRNLEYLRRYSPIGCRDEYTRSLLEKRGVPAYLQGCLTNTLPLRKGGSRSEVALIDCPQELLAYVPTDILSKARVISPFGRTPGNYYAEAKEYLDYISDHVGLAVTSRYHAATPCNAIGVPAVFLRSLHSNIDYDLRLSSINPYIPVHTSRTFSEIDWHPSYTSFESVKEAILGMAVSRLRDAAINPAEEQLVRDFYQPSLDFYRSSQNELKSDYPEWLRGRVKARVPYPARKAFYIWGAKRYFRVNDGAEIVNCICSANQNLQFRGWVDSFEKGKLFGKPIIHPDALTLDQDEIVIVVADKAADAAEKLFREKGLNPEQLLLCVSRAITERDVVSELTKRI